MAKVYLSGKAKWCKLFEPDEYNGVKKWKMDFFPDPKSFEVLKASGSRKHIKSDDDGRFVRLDRPVVVDFAKKGRTDLEAPRVIDAEGADWDPKVKIGNGSEVTVQIDVYDTKMGKGTRLEGVRIDVLVPFEGDDGDDLATVNVREIGSDPLPF
jgi:hypothetical protein